MRAYASIEDISMIHTNGSKIDVNTLLGDAFNEMLNDKIVEYHQDIE